MNKKFIALALLTMPLWASAQQLSVANKVIDCGQVIYKKPVTFEYKIKNTGNRPLIINKVLASCGCTKVNYPHQPIAPHTSAIMRATYDAKQLGTFQKELSIISNASTEPIILTLRGKIVTEFEHFSGDYPFSLGNLQTDVNNIEFDDVNRGERPQVKIHIRNNASVAAQPVLMHLPSYLKGEVSPSKIAPGHTGIATLTLHSHKIRDYGLTQTSIFMGFEPGDKVSPKKELTVTAVILPDFNHGNKRTHRTQPKMQLSTTELNLGSFRDNKKLKGYITIQNTGNSILDIERLQMFTNGLSISLNKSKIKAGKETKLKITAIAEQLKKARSKPRILMITNDPEQPKVIIHILVKE